MVNKIAWFLVFFVLMAGCLDEPDCYNLNNDFVGISFKKLADSRADTVSFIGYGTLEPPLIFSGDTTISKVKLPLDYFNDETTYFFSNADTTRFLKLGYLSQAQFVSENCGEKFVLSKLRVLEHSFDSVRVLSDIPSSDGGTTQIEIFQ
jgi:hypothetical protein